MITSYEVGAVFRISDQASAPLLKISEALTRLQTKLTGVKEGFASLGGANVAGISRTLLTLDKRFAASGETAIKAGGSIVASFAKADASIGATASAVARLNSELVRSRRVASTATTVPTTRGGSQSVAAVTRGLDAVEGRMGRVAPAAASAADAIISNFGRANTAIGATTSAVAMLTAELRQAGAASAGVSGIRGPRPGRGGGAGQGGGQDGSALPPSLPAGGGHGGNANWQHVGIGLGMGGFIGLHEVTRLGKDLLESGGERQHIITSLKKQNADDAEIAAAIARSRELTNKIKGVTEIGALETYATNRSLFGPEASLSLMEPLLKYTEVVGNQTGDYKAAQKKVYDMTKGADMLGQLVNHDTGKVDPDKFKNFLELGSKVTLGTHGKVDASTWLAMAQQGGPAMSGMSDKGLVTQAMVAQIMGGHRSGTALTSTFQQLVGEKMTTPVYENLMKLGLAGGHYVTNEKTGKRKLVREGVNEDLKAGLKDDPLAAVKLIRESMEKSGITDIHKQVTMLFEILGRQTSQRYIHELLQNAPQMLGERERMFQSKGIDTSKSIQDAEDLKQAEHNFSAAVKNLTTALGGPGVQTAIDALNHLGSGIQVITTAANANPATTKIVLEGLAGVGVAFAALAVAGVAAGAALLIPGGAVVLALTTVAGVLGTIAAFNWDSVKKGLDTMESVLNRIRDATLGFLGLGAGKKGVEQNPEDVLPGLKKDMSFSGPGLDQSMIHKTGLGTDGPFADAVYGGTLRAFREMMGGGSGGGTGGGGSGFQNASFTTGGGANDNIGGVASSGGGSVGRATRGAGGFDSGVTNSISGGVSGRAHHVMDRLIAKGWTREAAAVAAGNFVQESSVLPNGRSGDGGTAHGLAQWRFDRWDAAKAHIRANPHLSPLDAQIDFFDLERKRRGGLQAQMHALKDVNAANRAMYLYERYGDKSLGTRAGNARGLLRSHQGGGALIPTAPPPTAGPSPRPPEQPGITHVHLDGKTIARAVTTRIASDGRYPNKSGGMDTHGSWRDPGTPVTDAA